MRSDVRRIARSILGRSRWREAVLLGFLAVGLASAVLTASALAEEAQPYAPLSHPLKIEQVPGNSIYYRRRQSRDTGQGE